MLTKLFFHAFFCDGGCSRTHLQKSAYTLETLFKNVQFSVTSCKGPLVTEHRHKMQGFYLFFKRKNAFKNVQLMVTSCKKGGVTENGLNLQGF
jgi:gentisate 1,2-dioxygenase